MGSITRREASWPSERELFLYYDVSLLLVYSAVCLRENLKAAVPSEDFNRSETTGDCRESISTICVAWGSRHGVVGIATRYRLEGPGIESQWGWGPAPRPTQPPIQWVLGLSRGKGGRGVVFTTHLHLVCRSSRKRVELYLYSPWETLAAYNRMKPHFTILV